MLIRALRALLNGLGVAALLWLAWQGVGALLGGRSAAQPAVSVQAGPAIIQEVRRVNKQIFVEQYSSVDISYSEAPRGWLGALEQLGVRQHYVVLLRGRVPAGFDLQELSEGDIWVSADGKRAQVTLPAPRIFEENVAIDYDNTRILAEQDACPDLLCTSDLSAYNDTILPEGRQRLIEAAERNEILRMTALEGKLYYEKLLNQLGVAEVRVIVRGYDL